MFSLHAQQVGVETTAKGGLLDDKFWEWKGYKVRYQSAGEENTGGPSLVLIHGFGGEPQIRAATKEAPSASSSC